MARTCRGAFVLAVMVAFAALCGAQEAQQVERLGAGAQMALRPAVDCSADAASVFQGQTVVIRAKGTSPAGGALRYSFATSAGELVANGATTEVRTGGVAAGILLVTCTVIDGEGRTGSAKVSITVRDRRETEEKKRANPSLALTWWYRVRRRRSLGLSHRGNNSSNSSSNRRLPRSQLPHRSPRYRLLL
jgi:hypothetical protein